MASGYSGKSAIIDAVRLRGGVSRHRRVLRGVCVLHGAANHGAQPISIFFLSGQIQPAIMSVYGSVCAPNSHTDATYRFLCACAFACWQM